MNKMMQEQQSKQQAFDETTQAYVSKYAMDNSYREENALKLDVSNTTDILPDQRNGNGQRRTGTIRSPTRRYLEPVVKCQTHSKAC